jgi:site-specific recombinase XerD
MGLCQNVYRRGGVYWWRRRTKVELGSKSHYLHLSLKVRDPRCARILAARVGVEADRLELSGMLDAAKKSELLKLFIESQAQNLDRYAQRAAHADADREASAEPVEEKIRREKQISIVYSAIAARGPAAALPAGDAAAMLGSGFSEQDVNEIKDKISQLREMVPRLASDGSLAATGPNGLLGPDNDFFRTILAGLGVEADEENIDLVRSIWMRATSVAYADTGRRYPPLYETPTPARQTIADAASSPANAPAPLSATSVASALAPKTKVHRTITGQINKMIELKKGSDWKITKRGDQNVSDTAESYQFLGRFLVKMIGRDDASALTQEHAVDLHTWLKRLPTNFGKSQAHWNLTFDQAIAEAKAQNKPIGRAGTTITKYLTYLQSLLRFMEGNGVSVAINSDLIKSIKPKDKRKNNEKRAAFTEEDYETLFADKNWTAQDVVHDSTYWVPLLTRYGGGRLEEPCGLLLDEVDFACAVPSYTIQENGLRTIKTDARRIPFHSELLRLGIRNYYEAVKALGYKELFPDLRLRGTKTAIGSLLNKKFVPILDRALPEARENKKTQHSSRKSMNTELRDNKIDITVRCELLGHAQEGVNSKVYMDPARDTLKLQAIGTIANVTSHVPTRPIRLNALLLKATDESPQPKPRAPRRRK